LKKKRKREIQNPLLNNQTKKKRKKDFQNRMLMTTKTKRKVMKNKKKDCQLIQKRIRLGADF